MTKFDNALALIAHAEGELKLIEEGYRASLNEKTVKAAMLISIKNLMENLRSALDYSAHAIFEKYGSSTKSNPKIYFPYATASQTLADFQREKRIESCIPGISAHPKVISEIESFQHCSDKTYSWLPKFMALNNENKHQNLTPQTRKETKQLKIESRGAGISLGHGASISIGKGASITIGGMKIGGGQVIDVNNPPVTSGEGKVEVITWVSFNFTDNGEPVLPLLKESVEGTKRIVQRLTLL